MLAVQNRHFGTVKVLLGAAGVDVNAQRGDDGAFALFVAAEFTRDVALSPAETAAALDIVVALVRDQCVDVNQRMPDGRTALAAAAGHGHVPVVRALLTHPQIDVNSRTPDGATPLHFAAGADASVAGEVARLLLAHIRIEPNSPKEKGGASPLHMGAWLGNAAFTRALLDDQAVDPNIVMSLSGEQVPDSGITPLGYAAMQGHKEVVQALVAHPAIAIDQPNQAGLSPLMLACIKRHTTVAQLLLSAGASPKGPPGTPLSRAPLTYVRNQKEKDGGLASILPDMEAATAKV
jgi:ankyrin repeat protein